MKETGKAWQQRVPATPIIGGMPAAIPIHQMEPVLMLRGGAAKVAGFLG